MDFFQLYQTGYTLVPNDMIEHYHALKLTADEFLVITCLLAHQTTEHANQSIERLAQNLGWSADVTMQVIGSLINKKLLHLEVVHSAGKKYDRFSLQPLFDQLVALRTTPEVLNSQQALNVDEEMLDFKQLLQEFEKVFGRLLTAKELEILNQWLKKDHYDISLIKLALKEAVVHQAYNFTYIDRILLGWEKENVKTPLEAQNQLNRYSKKEDKYRKQQLQNFDHIEIPIYKFNQEQSKT